MYDQIAPDWKKKRIHPWKPLVSLLGPYLRLSTANSEEKSNTTGIFLDIGAGSGRHAAYLQQFCRILIELDQSREMLKQNTSTSLKIQADMLSLPFRENVVDGLFSIASIHHIKGNSNRIKVIESFRYIAKPDAWIVITVWRFKQKNFLAEYKRQLQENTYAIFGQKNLDNQKNLENHKISDEIGDVMVPWKISQNRQIITISRFYHLFRAAEFRKLIRPFTSILIKSFGNQREKNNFLFMGKNA